jgi:hypothetical protein
MTEIPKIVYDRLRAAGPERAHPDADLLTAFAEQMLSAVERDGVIEHLARCGDCREIITLALPDTDIATAPIADEAEAGPATSSRAPAPRKLSFSWPSLRWAALAAGVVVVASVLLMRPGKLNQSTPSPAGLQVATTAQPVSSPQIASSQVASSTVVSPPIASPPIKQSALAAKTDETRPQPELQLSRKLKPVTPALQAQSGMLLAENKKESAQADKLTSAPMGAAGALAFDGSARPAATETIEGSNAVSTVEPAPSAEGNLMTRNEAPAIEKAKPAPQGVEATAPQKTTTAGTFAPAQSQARNMASAGKPAPAISANPAPAQHATWAITAGVLQRSLDGGQSWQSALRRDHPLLCYANHGADIWTGGQAGTLFHSADGGLTWAQVQPAIEGQQLSADITHIDLSGDVSGPPQVVISASNNQIWSSTDGGKTWEKQ